MEDYIGQTPKKKGTKTLKYINVELKYSLLFGFEETEVASICLQRNDKTLMLCHYKLRIYSNLSKVIIRAIKHI